MYIFLKNSFPPLKTFHKFFSIRHMLNLKENLKNAVKNCLPSHQPAFSHTSHSTDRGIATLGLPLPLLPLSGDCYQAGWWWPLHQGSPSVSFQTQPEKFKEIIWGSMNELFNGIWSKIVKLHVTHSRFISVL